MAFIQICILPPMLYGNIGYQYLHVFTGCFFKAARRIRNVILKGLYEIT